VPADYFQPEQAQNGSHAAGGLCAASSQHKDAMVIFSLAAILFHITIHPLTP
jgi:hypothetical protein